MCGRYLVLNRQAIQKLFSVVLPLESPDRYNVAPSQDVPAILRPEDHEAWLAGTAEEAWACLKQYPDELRSAWPVSKRVNNPRNDGPELIERVQ